MKKYAAIDTEWRRKTPEITNNSDAESVRDAIKEDEEEEKRKKYNPDDIFKDKTSIQNNVALIEVKENFITKFIKKLKNIFHIN